MVAGVAACATYCACTGGAYDPGVGETTGDVNIAAAAGVAAATAVCGAGEASCGEFKLTFENPSAMLAASGLPIADAGICIAAGTADGAA